MTQPFQPLAFTPEKLVQLLQFRLGEQATLLPDQTITGSFIAETSGILESVTLCNRSGTMTLTLGTGNGPHTVSCSANGAQSFSTTDGTRRFAISLPRNGLLVLEPAQPQKDR